MRLSSKSTMSLGSTPMSAPILCSRVAKCFYSMPYASSDILGSCSPKRASIMWVAIMGFVWASLLGSNFPRSSLKWIQRVGIFRIGSLQCQYLLTSFPWSLTMTFPARVRSLSNHVCQSPPPYVMTFNCCNPHLSLSLELGAILKTGESVWHPTTLKEEMPSGAFEPYVNATKVELFLVKKNLLPFERSQWSLVDQ